MSSIDGVLKSGFSLSSVGLSRFLPEPKSRLGFNFGNVLNGLLGTATNGVGLGGLNPELADLITKQLEVQQQMTMVSLVSNVEKSRHESQMAAIRNIRAS